MLTIVLIVLLALLLILAFPRWPYNLRWGYSPVTIIALLLIILIILMLFGVV